jgi:hypothetical protein
LFDHTLDILKREMITFRRIGLFTCVIASVLFLWFAFQMCVLVIADMRVRTTESLSGGSRSMIANEPTFKQAALESAYRLSPELRAYVTVMHDGMTQSASEGKLDGSVHVVRGSCAPGDRRLQDIVDWLIIDNNEGLANAYIRFAYSGVSNNLYLTFSTENRPGVMRDRTEWTKASLFWGFGN